MRMTRILRITLKYKFVKPIARRSEQHESAARPVCGARRALKLFSTLSEHFFGNESTQNRTKVHKMASNAVQSSSPPCTVVTCDDRCDKRSYSVVVQKITHLLPRSPQVAPLQLCTIPVYKFCFSPISHISRLSQKIQVSPPSRTLENVKIKGCSVQNATPLVGDVTPFR